MRNIPSRITTSSLFRSPGPHGLGAALLLGLLAHAAPVGAAPPHGAAAGTPELLRAPTAASLAGPALNCGPDGSRICTPHGCYCV